MQTINFHCIFKLPVMRYFISAFILTTFIIFCASFAPVSAQVVINEYSVSNLGTIQDNYEEYEDWIELYNKGGFTVNIGGFYLSDQPDAPLRWQFPAGTTIPSGGYLLVWASGRDEVLGGNYHTNFRLSQTKESPDWIVFTDNDGIMLEQYQLENTQIDHSRGRTLNGGDQWGVFTAPTPGSSNNSAADYARYALRPIVSDTGGYYSGPLSITISTTEPNSVIRYTTNGNDPTSTSTLYSGPSISATLKS
jgi:hypothetical protein